MTLTRRQQEILLHMTGLDRSKEQYRTHYATDEQTEAWQPLEDMVTMGLVHPPVQRRKDVWAGLWFFHVTEAGIAEANRLAAERAKKQENPCPN